VAAATSDATDLPPKQSPQQHCEALAGSSAGGATVGMVTFEPATEIAPEQCVVTGTLHGTLNFRIKLPSYWNGKLLVLGGGGWNGSIPASAYSASGNTDGYVVSASDGGRQGSGLDAASFLDNPQGQQDFGYLSIHSTYEVAMEIIQKRYGRLPVYRYFEGCSNGGREALVQATRFPNDYDGIVVRAPAYSFTELFQHFVAIGQALREPGGAISDAKAAAISKAALAACDADDGLADGLVSRPQTCTFDPASLRCSGSEGDDCLTEPQISTARVIYSELKRADSRLVYPGWGPGGEDLGWPAWINGSTVGGTGLQFQFGSGLIKYWITQDPGFDVLTFDPELYRPELALAATTLDASADLGTFFNRGGRMVLVHGTHDWAISYKGSVKYFNDVAMASGGEARRDQAMEMFLQPGVQHCSGGTGPDSVDLLAAVSTWVESGKRPSTQNIVARKRDPGGATVLSRPLCRYPTFPKYKGSGSEADAANFTCQAN
jgi:feruloyl esterase